MGIAAGDRALRGDQRLRQHLAAEHPLPAVVGEWPRSRSSPAGARSKRATRSSAVMRRGSLLFRRWCGPPRAASTQAFRPERKRQPVALGTPERGSIPEWFWPTNARVAASLGQARCSLWRPPHCGHHRAHRIRERPAKTRQEIRENASEREVSESKAGFGGGRSLGVRRGVSMAFEELVQGRRAAPAPLVLDLDGTLVRSISGSSRPSPASAAIRSVSFR